VEPFSFMILQLCIASGPIPHGKHSEHGKHGKHKKTPSINVY
jgi:hypothetical protein